MAPRTSISTQVYTLAEKHGVTKIMVQNILHCYLEYCKDLILQGWRVDFPGVVSLVPDVIVSDFCTTLAFECEKVADALVLPPHSVYSIIKAYIDDIKDSVLGGTIYEIRGIVVIRPILNLDNEIITVHSNISQSLRHRLEDMDTPVTSIRVHTSRAFRDLCKGGVTA